MALLSLPRRLLRLPWRRRHGRCLRLAGLGRALLSGLLLLLLLLRMLLLLGLVVSKRLLKRAGMARLVCRGEG